MFKIICTECGNAELLVNGKNKEEKIELRGEIGVLFDADIYIECTCGNLITLES